ncbi:hypothetical protein FACS189430_07040 [Bacteroidia bacterium]|nr:hypothetical protein FACS189430_07040 [Bacteroidia bacterium]
MDSKALGNVDNIVKHWVETSDDDFKVMLTLLKAKQNSWALFLGHIVIEKLLKAYYVKLHSKHAPLTHNLLRLAQDDKIAITDEQAVWLNEVTSFNLNARYDDYKQNFYALCTSAYTAEWAEKIKQLRLWIKDML